MNKLSKLLIIFSFFTTACGELNIKTLIKENLAIKKQIIKKTRNGSNSNSSSKSSNIKNDYNFESFKQDVADNVNTKMLDYIAVEDKNNTTIIGNKRINDYFTDYQYMLGLKTWMKENDLTWKSLSNDDPISSPKKYFKKYNDFAVSLFEKSVEYIAAFNAWKGQDDTNKTKFQYVFGKSQLQKDLKLFRDNPINKATKEDFFKIKKEVFLKEYSIFMDSYFNASPNYVTTFNHWKKEDSSKTKDQYILTKNYYINRLSFAKNNQQYVPNFKKTINFLTIYNVFVNDLFKVTGAYTKAFKKWKKSNILFKTEAKYISGESKFDIDLKLYSLFGKRATTKDFAKTPEFERNYSIFIDSYFRENEYYTKVFKMWKAENSLKTEIQYILTNDYYNNRLLFARNTKKYISKFKKTDDFFIIYNVFLNNLFKNIGHYAKNFNLWKKGDNTKTESEYTSVEPQFQIDFKAYRDNPKNKVTENDFIKWKDFTNQKNNYLNASKYAKNKFKKTPYFIQKYKKAIYNKLAKQCGFSDSDNSQATKEILCNFDYLNIRLFDFDKTLDKNNKIFLNSEFAIKMYLWFTNNVWYGQELLSLKEIRFVGNSKEKNSIGAYSLENKTIDVYINKYIAKNLLNIPSIINNQFKQTNYYGRTLEIQDLDLWKYTISHEYGHHQTLTYATTGEV